MVARCEGGDRAGGSLVFTSSGSAFFGQPRGQHYGGSKAAIIAMSQAHRRRVRPLRRALQRHRARLDRHRDGDRRAALGQVHRAQHAAHPGPPLGRGRRLRRHRRVPRQPGDAATTPATSSRSTAATTSSRSVPDRARRIGRAARPSSRCSPSAAAAVSVRARSDCEFGPPGGPRSLQDRDHVAADRHGPVFRASDPGIAARTGQRIRRTGRVARYRRYAADSSRSTGAAATPSSAMVLAVEAVLVPAVQAPAGERADGEAEQPAERRRSSSGWP